MSSSVEVVLLFFGNGTGSCSQGSADGGVPITLTMARGEKQIQKRVLEEIRKGNEKKYKHKKTTNAHTTITSKKG
jgi:hypothetical protein